MTPIRHPKDFISLEAYKADIAKIRERLSNQMIALRQSGDSVKSILHILKYLKIMLFSISEPKKYTKPEKIVVPVPLKGSLSVSVFEYPSLDLSTYGTLSFVLLKDVSFGSLNVGVFEYPVINTSNYGTLNFVLLQEQAVGNLRVGVFEYPGPNVEDYGTLNFVLLYDDQQP